MIASLLVCATIQAQETIPDIQGWSTTKWGMTEKEILEASPGAERAPGAPWLSKGVNIGIRAYTIQGTDYLVMFLLDKGGLLEKVQLSPHEIKGTRGLLMSPPVMERLEALLVDKYGQPKVSSEETTAGMRTSVRSWVFPHTVIELRRIDELHFGFSIVALAYRKNGDKDKI